MTDDTYRDDDEKEEKKEKKDEKKKKSVTLKATSSKGKAKQESSSENEDSSFDEFDDEKMALFVKEIWQIHGEEGLSCKKKEIFIQEQRRVKKVLQVWKQRSSCCSMPIQQRQ